MNTEYDTCVINHMITAISHEMVPPRGRPQPYADTLFMGGPTLSETERNELALHGQSKNWKIIFPCFDPAQVSAGPIGFDAVITDGIAQTIVLCDGRLWKRDRHSPAVLIFAGSELIVKLSGGGRLIVRQMRGRYHDHGYEIAREAVLRRAAKNPGTVPVIAAIRGLTAVMDMKTLSTAFAAGQAASS
jgi:hypothetical protein